jgi:hypothetical protein
VSLMQVPISDQARSDQGVGEHRSAVAVMALVRRAAARERWDYRSFVADLRPCAVRLAAAHARDAWRWRCVMGATSNAASERPDPNVITCPLCGTRLRRNDDPDAADMGRDSLMTVADHRCVPRVHARSTASAGPS